MRAIIEPETMDELISDCADLPDSVLHAGPAAPAQQEPDAWRVDEECLATVAGLDDYGS